RKDTSPTDGTLARRLQGLSRAARCIRRFGCSHLPRPHEPIQWLSCSSLMISVALFLSILRLAGFSSFTYCRENSRGLYELQCVQLDSTAKGEVKFKRRQAEAVNVQIQLSPPAQQRFMAVLEATNYLAQSETYESGRKVADLGRKHLTLQLPSEKREATFNYSDRKEVMD